MQENRKQSADRLSVLPQSKRCPPASEYLELSLRFSQFLVYLALGFGSILSLESRSDINNPVIVTCPVEQAWVFTILEPGPGVQCVVGHQTPTGF